jgi:hypothetical protein
VKPGARCPALRSSDCWVQPSEIRASVWIGRATNRRSRRRRSRIGSLSWVKPRPVAGSVVREAPTCPSGRPGGSLAAATRRLLVVDSGSGVRLRNRCGSSAQLTPRSWLRIAGPAKRLSALGGLEEKQCAGNDSLACCSRRRSSQIDGRRAPFRLREHVGIAGLRARLVRSGRQAAPRGGGALP